MKILSRKVLASMLVFITATIFVWYGKITGIEWVTLAVATVIAYIAGEGVSATVKYVKTKANKSLFNASLMETEDKIPFAVRLKNLLNTSFLAAVIVYAVATILMWNAKISTTEWNYVAIGTIIGYDMLNPIEKIKAGK